MDEVVADTSANRSDPDGREGDDRRIWHTPTGEPCPRWVHVDGRVDEFADCHGCGFCLLLAGLPY